MGRTNRQRYFTQRDEYDVKPDYRNSTYYIAICPVCNKEKAYEE